MKSILRVFLWTTLFTYLMFPLYLYGFTPMGAAVLVTVHKTLSGDKPLQALSPVASEETSPVQAEAEPTPAKEQPITVLLLGYGGPGHDGAYLTDSMMLAIADPKTKSLTLFSIPRDTLVKLPLDQQNWSWSKINTAYAYGTDETIYKNRPVRYKGPQGGGTMAKDAVAGVTGIPVRYYIALDFNAFRKLIDELGGLDVDVPDSFAALYPADDSSAVNDDWMVVRFQAGKQHMNGERALEYSRAREAIENMAEGSDFARSRRQRLIMETFKDKVMSPGGLIHLPGLLSIANERIHTDIQVPSLGEIQQLLTDWRGVKITEAALTSDNYLTSDGSTENGYYLSPVAGQDNWTQLHTFVQILINNPDLGAALARTKILIRNGSGQPERARELRAKLMAQGFVVAPVETVAAQPTTHIEDMSEGDSPVLMEALKTALGDPNIPVENTGYPSLRIAVVLGKDNPSPTPTATP